MVRSPTKSWGFPSLPAELRLQIFANTHLGPPSTGGYHPRNEVLQVRDGRVVPWYHPCGHDSPSEKTCTSPTTHKTTNPQRRCRILPTQLFTLSRQTSIEALEVFYKNLHLELDPCSSLAFLRSLSPQRIHLLPRLTFVMTPAHVEGWCDGAAASGYYPGQVEARIAPVYWGGGPVPRDDYRGKWREVVGFLAAHANLPRLELTVEMAECTWVYFEDECMMDDDDRSDLSTFRFMYDLYIDVATALCGLRGLGGLVLELSMFEQLKPWLEREVLGREPPEPKLEDAYDRMMWENLWNRTQWYQVVPRWHDGDKRLEGSNFRPEN